MTQKTESLNKTEKIFIKTENSLKGFSYIPVVSVASGALIGCLGAAQLALGVLLTLGTFVFSRLTGSEKLSLAAKRFVQWIPNGIGNIARGLAQMIPFSGNLACYIQDRLPDETTRYFQYKPVQENKSKFVMEMVTFSNGQTLQTSALNVDPTSRTYQKYIQGLEES